MSSVQFASPSKETHEDNNNERLDLLLTKANAMDPTLNMSLSTDTFLKAALSLKQQVVDVTWRRGGAELSSGAGTGIDPTLYTGLLGTAFTCFRSYEITGNHNDLRLSAQVVDTCAAVVRASTRHVTFLCGRGGIYALGAVVANYMGDHQRRDFFLNLFLEIAQEKALPVGPEEGGFGMSYDLMYGRAGFLWAALFINKYLGPETLPNELLMPIVDAVLAGGRAGASDNTACPLMYRWHEDAEDVKGTLRYMMSNRFPHSGNYLVSEGNPRDKLVQWSHGATGIAITLCKASQVFPSDREFRNAAIEAGEVVWKNGLVKKVGLADGAAGNAYAFLSLYRLTGESIYEERAKAFASFLYHNAQELLTADHGHGADHGFSLYQGLAGAACFWFDLLAPANSRFPGYEL
ncbi:hypothetical protein Pint_27617 [Pistacia integerrima]|uniref:Uncharacterized protein n=1 Tax=Pistacia integerrima TaxID=434235 RepID=A0ACC0YT46_9ROSI|nr:hypothetical protein Pint_27617 [Pistacia integerrima]